MKVADLMTTELTCVKEDSSVADALLTLADAHIHGVPVLDARGRFVGVLSTSDVLEAASECASTAEREGLFGETLVRDIMTTRPQTCSPDDDVKQAAQEMLYLDVHRLFVECEGELVGVISQSDIVGAVATSKI
jgi:CBS domain-containing protein